MVARRWVRVAIVIATLAALGFSGIQVRLAEQAIDAEQDAERTFTDLSWAFTLSLADLRAAQQAYVAVGQNLGEWTSAVGGLLDTANASLDNLRQLATETASIEALDAADDALADLTRIDQRAREHTVLGQSLLASDLIFTEGLNVVDRAAAQVEFARTVERSTRVEAVRSQRQAQATFVASAGGVALLAILVLTPVARKQNPDTLDDQADTAVSDLTGDSAWASPEQLMLGSDDSPTTGESAETDTAAPQPDLRAAAELCTDLSMVGDTNELPPLLARAAEIMNASGLIVWVHDSSGHVLRPAIGHGYSEQSLARLGSIPDDGKNATAAACRNVQMQVVERNETGIGALATPLRSVDRCLGVLSAELRDGWESSEAVQASAAIIAAQIATLLPSDPVMEPAAPAATTQESA